MSASQPEHELHQRYLVHVGTASALAALATATATATATAHINFGTDSRHGSYRACAPARLARLCAEVEYLTGGLHTHGPRAGRKCGGGGACLPCPVNAPVDSGGRDGGPDGAGSRWCVWGVAAVSPCWRCTR